MKPIQLYNLPKYSDLKAFSLEKFRKHLHQEIYKQEKLVSKARYKKKGLRASAPELMSPEQYTEWVEFENEKEEMTVERAKKAKEKAEKKKKATAKTNITH